MKKRLIPVFLLIISIAGCGKDKDNPAVAIGNPTAQIMPAGFPTGNMNVTTQAGMDPHQVLFSAFFIKGNGAPQMVTINGPAGPIATFISDKGFQAVRPLAPANGQNITVSVSGNNYTGIRNIPAFYGQTNNIGFNISEYGDAMGDTTVIVVQDAALLSP